MKLPFMRLIAPASILIPIGIALFRYRKVPASTRIICWYLLTSILIYLVSTALAIQHVNNLWVIHTDTIIESLFLLGFFRGITPTGAGKLAITALQALFPAYCLINLFFIQGIHRYNTYSRPVEAILFICLSMFYYWRTGGSDGMGTWTSMPLNWIVSGILLYFAGAFFLFVFSNMLITRYGSTSSSLLIWNLHAGLIMAMYLMFAIGFSQKSVDTDAKPHR